MAQSILRRVVLLVGLALLSGNCAAWPGWIVALFGGSGGDSALLIPPTGGSEPGTGPSGLSYTLETSYNEGAQVSLSPTLAAGGPANLFRVAAGTFPADLVLDPVTGLIEGTTGLASSAGSPYNVTVEASTSEGAAQAALSFVIIDPTVKSASLSYAQGGNTTGPFRAGTVTVTATFQADAGGTPLISIDQPGTNDIAGAAMSGSGTTWTYAYTVNPAGGANADGTAGVSLSATPAAGGSYSAATNASFVIDTDPPTAGIGAPSAAVANATATISYTVIYTGSDATNLTSANISLNTTGSATCPGITIVGGTTANPTVQLSGCTGNGTVGINVAAGRSSDVAGNTDIGAGPSAVFTVDNTNPSVPAGLSTTAFSNSTSATVLFTNGSDPNFSTHNVQACSNPGCSVGCVGAITDPVSPATVSGLTDGVSYYLCVQSVDLAGNTSVYVATPGTVTIDTTNPAAPGAVSITQGSHHNATSIDISFTNGTDANFSTHNIQACTDSGCSAGCVGASTDTSSPATITGLSAGSTYYACVQSVDNAGNTSSYVASAAAVTIDPVAPNAPSGVSITQGTHHNATSIDITFTNGTDAVSFATHNIQACTNAGCSVGCVGGSQDPSSPATITGLSAGSTYYACVQSVDTAGNTSTGFVASAAAVTIDLVAPNAPSGVSITQGTHHNATSIDVTFANGTDAVSFATHNIQACTDSGCSAGCVGASQDASSPATITGLSAGSTYYACVQSVDTAGNTSAGYVASAAAVTIDPVAPTAPSGVGITQGTHHNATSIDITFTDGTDAVSFGTHNIQACTDSGCSAGCVGVSQDPSSPATISGLSAGSSYYACVQSLDSAGNTSAYVASAASVTIDLVAPSAPSGVSITQGTHFNGSTIDVTFTDGTDAVSFGTHNLRACTDSGCSLGCVGASTDPGSPAQISGMLDGNTYYACVQSVDSAGNTSTGFVASGDTVIIDSTLPAAPSGVTVPAWTNSGSVSVSFTNGTDANFSTHNVKACSDSGCSVGCVGDTTDPSSPATVGSLVNGNSYYACVQSVDFAGNTSAGFVASAATVTVDTDPPTVSVGPPSPIDVRNGVTATYTVMYTGASSINLLAGDIVLNKTGTADCGTVTVVNGTTATPDVQLSNCTGDGTVRISVAAGRSSDAAGNTDTGAVASTPFNVDNVPPTISIGAPSVSQLKNGDTLTYTVTYSGATSVNLTGGDISLNTTGSATCSTVNIVNGTTDTPDVQLSGCTGDGTVAITVAAAKASDAAGNTDPGAGPSLTALVDNTLPVISSVAPASSANVNNTLVSYTLSEICASGSVTWTRTGGAADPSAPHVQALSGSELNAGAHNNVTLTNNPTLVDTAIYDISFNCTDRVGLVAATITSTSVTFSDAPLQITSAQTLDTNSNGKIDTYRISFNKAVNDSTFPGYSVNALGSVTTDWLVAGYNGVRLIHGTAVTFATDTANDAVIYVRFNESPTACSASSQAGCDTGAKPDLTTTAAPALQDLATNTLAQVGTAAVTESDGSKPILVAARSLGANSLDAIFSEAIDQATAETIAYYTLTGGLSVTGATRDGSSFGVVHLVTTAQTGGTNYTLTVNTDVKDLNNLNLSATANSVAFDGLVKPVVQSIASTNATTLTITFNEAIVAATAECSNSTACAAIYENASLPVLAAVSTGGAGVNSATFTLTVNAMTEGQNYTTIVKENTATSVASGEKMGSTNNSATFVGDGRPAPYVHGDTATECPANAAKRVIVQYDQPVGASALTLANYKITQCESGGCATGLGSPNSDGAASVTSLGANQYAVNFTDAFNTSGDAYRLNVSGVLDTNGNAVATPTNLSFQCGNDSTGPVLITADVVSSDNAATLVMLTFSEAVDSVEANKVGSYKYDANAFGFGVNTAAVQTNPSQVLVTFAPGLANGGHQIVVRNVQDLVANAILENGTNNVQPIIINAATGFAGGNVFQDPFGDGTTAGTIVIYDGQLYVGADSAAAKLFEADYALTTSRTIILDADGTPGAPLEDFFDYVSTNSGTIKGVDTLYAACVGGTATPGMTGSACTGASGTERLFIGALNVTGNYISYWSTTDKSSTTTTFTFTEGLNPDTGGAFAYRSTVFTVFKDYLWNHFGAEAGGGGRGGRICVNPAGCSTGQSDGQGVRQRPNNFARVGNSPGGTTIFNGSRASNVTGNPNYLNAINVVYEHDNDGAGGNASQLYIANGGVYKGTLGQARSGHSDGGILRTRLAYSTKTSLPADCSVWAAGCDTYWEDVTPDANTKWNNFVSIPLPQNSAVTGEANCGTSGIEFDCIRPYNIFVPAMKAIPYMRTAPNGDLYMLRNSCASQQVCVNGATDLTGFGGCEFRTTRQVCPTGSGVPQLWMLPANCGTAAQCAVAWKLVAEYGSTTLTGTVTITTASGSVTGTGTAFSSELAVGDLVTINGQVRRVATITNNTTMTLVGNGNASSSGHLAVKTSGATNMAANTASCGTSPNICLSNRHITLLEFVGNYIYVGFDNVAYGSNVWRADMTSVTSGNLPLESNFEMVNIPGLDGTATNQRLFSHVTVNSSGIDWLILTTRDGTNSMQLYRTANGQN